MPVVFGPSAGPRQGPEGETYDYSEAPRTTAAVSFLTTAAALERLLPPHCVLDAEPVVTVEHVELRELEWLAGRGYSLLGVKFPVRYRGPAETARGPFPSVLWENRVEPILSGREELGFAKLFCELPPPRVLGGVHNYSAIWDGHTFIRMSLSGLEEASPPQAARVDGTIHHRFFPRVARTGEAEIEQMVLTPNGGGPIRHERYRKGRGTVEFVRSKWEQLPTMFQIINALADLPIIEPRGGSISDSRGAKDLSDQRVLG
jgi:Acetoacetate decarboxylase (ADC)